MAAGVVGHGAVGHGVVGVGHGVVGHGDNKMKRSSIPQQSTHDRETTIHKFFLIVISNV